MDYTALIQAIIALAATLITAYLIPYIKAKAGAAKYEKIMAVVRVSVRAAEQLYGAGKGDEKLKYVEQRLLEQGIKVDLATIKDMIEAEVYKLTEGVAALVPIPEDSYIVEK